MTDSALHSPQAFEKPLEDSHPSIRSAACGLSSPAISRKPRNPQNRARSSSEGRVEKQERSSIPFDATASKSVGRTRKTRLRKKRKTQQSVSHGGESAQRLPQVSRF